MEIMNHHCENAVFDLQNKVLKMPKYLFIENIKNIIMHTACCYIWKKNNKNASACSNALYICNYKKTSFPKSTNYYFFQHDICKFFINLYNLMSCAGVGPNHCWFMSSDFHFSL